MKILFITNSCLGDVILTTGIIKNLIDTDDNLELYIIKDKRSKNIFEDFPKIKYIYEYSKMKYSVHWLFILKDFFFNYFDIIYDFKNSIGRILFANQKYIYYNDNNHIIHSIKSQFNLDYLPKPYIFIDSEKCKNYVNKYIKDEFISVVPTCFDKDINEKYYIDIIYYIINYTKYKCVLLGSNIENNFFEKYKNKFENKVLNLINKTSVLESTYLISYSKLFIGRDSALYHIAQALNIKSIIFFKHKNFERYKPINDNINTFIIDNTIIKKDIIDIIKSI